MSNLDMTRVRRFGHQFKSIDAFSTNVEFRENGGDSFGSICGATLTLMIGFLVAAFAAKKLLFMSLYLDTAFNNFIVKNELTEDFIE